MIGIILNNTKMRAENKYTLINIKLHSLKNIHQIIPIIFINTFTALSRLHLRHDAYQMYIARRAHYTCTGALRHLPQCQ